jgi:hypothetical protein
MITTTTARKEIRHHLAIAFDRLPRLEQQQLIDIAKQKMANCFMCRLIIQKVKKDNFPTDSKKVHLMLCCDPEALSNRQFLEEN